MINIAVSLSEVFEPCAKAITNTKMAKGRICSLIQNSNWKQMSCPITHHRHKRRNEFYLQIHLWRLNCRDCKYLMLKHLVVVLLSISAELCNLSLVFKKENLPSLPIMVSYRVCTCLPVCAYIHAHTVYIN